MSLLELSGKVVESAANLSQKRIEISAELLKIYYDQQDRPKNLQSLMKDYAHILDELKELTPPEQTVNISSHDKKMLKIAVGVIAIFATIVAFFIYKVGLGNLIDYVR